MSKALFFKGSINNFENMIFLAIKCIINILLEEGKDEIIIFE